MTPSAAGLVLAEYDKLTEHEKSLLWYWLGTHSLAGHEELAVILAERKPKAAEPEAE